jgi:hypothetical protein
MTQNALANLTAWDMLFGSPKSRACRTCRWQRPQTCSSATATAGTAREVRLKEALCHLGWQVLGRILQSFAGEALQVRFDEADDAVLIRAAEFP